MRALLHLLLGLVWMPSVATAQKLEAPVPVAGVVLNVDGEVLVRPRILSFDGMKFDVEHDLGIASIIWQRMPEEIRQRFPFDPTRAQALEQMAEERRAALAAAVPTPKPKPEPSPTPTPAAPTVIRRELRLSDLYILSTIGGPAGDLKITNVTQTEVSFSRYKYGSETRELKLGFGEPRTLLFSVPGCDVYFVNVRDRPRYHAVVEFEYAPGKAPVER